MISLSALSNKLKAEKSVALICHVRPDGDTLGSALALKLALNQLGVTADVYCDDPVPSRFFFLNETSLVKNFFDSQFYQIWKGILVALAGILPCILLFGRTSGRKKGKIKYRPV